MHPSPTTPVSYFNFYVICSYFQHQIKFWLVFQGCLIHIYLQYVPHFDSLIHSIPSCDIFFSSFACIGWQRFLLFISTALGRYRADLYFYFHIKCSVFFAEILSFGFCLVNSECDAYLPVDHSLVYGDSKMFLILSLILV